MTLEVDVQFASEQPGLPSAGLVGQWAAAAWRDPQAVAEVVVRITDEAESRQLNRDFRDIDRPTNVLSFPYEVLPEIELHHAGDLVVCAPVVEREAEAQGKQVQAHWAHMVVHGMLHLQGFDHQDDTQAAQMESLETEILTALGFPAPYANDEMQ